VILALLNGRAGVGKTTLALHLAAAWASKRERVILIDADPRQDALRWHETRVRAGLPPLFRVVPAAPARLDRRALERLFRRSDRVIIDGPSGDAALSLPALLACDLAVIPTLPSPADAGAALEMVGLVIDAGRRRPGLPVRFVFNRRGATSDAARETAEMRIEYEPVLLDTAIAQDPFFGAAVQSGRLVRELDADSPAVHEIAALAADVHAIPIADRPAGSFSDRILPRLLRPWVRTDLRADRRTRPSEAMAPDGAAPRLPVAFPTDGGRS
jgi:chromosome partitioning protein